MTNLRSIVVASIALTLMLLNFGYSKPPKQWQPHGRSALIFDKDTRLDVNNLEMFVYNDGRFAHDEDNVLGKSDGLYYPRGTKKTVLYSAGIWVGAKVDGSPNVAAAEYSSEFGPGPMLNGNYQPDNGDFRCYMISKGDTGESNPDYADWPVSQGAPADELGKPEILGDRMIWCVFNDANVAYADPEDPYLTWLGIEIQQSAFAFARQGGLGNTCFLKYKIINKGSNNLQDTYVSIWVDPDLGDASDDLVGCDTLLGLGYCYNDGSDYTYGAAPPAVAVQLLQGPVVPGSALDSALIMDHWRSGYRNLPMTAFTKYVNGTDPAGAIEYYGYMRGLERSEPGVLQPVLNPVTNTVTTFAVSGDPVTNTGWVDNASGDRRMMISSGPFNMVPGDTQEVIVAVLVAQGNSAINSISSLRSYAVYAKGVFTHGFASSALPACGDANWSGAVNLADVIYVLDYIFNGGPAPSDFQSGDVNCDGNLSISDCVSLIYYLYAGANKPCAHCGGQ